MEGIIDQAKHFPPLILTTVQINQSDRFHHSHETFDMNQVLRGHGSIGTSVTRFS